MTLIEVKNLSVQYNAIEALSNITFNIEKGDYLGVVGPNGSGKTSIIKAMLELVKYSGEITFSGNTLSKFLSSRHIGYLPQKMSYLDQRFPATAREIVLSGVYCCKKFPKRLSTSDYMATATIMETLEIANLADRPVGKLSGGQQQRVLLARAMVHHPEILILDEPTVALDPQSRELFYITIQKLNKENGVTIILVSHDTGIIGNYASKLLYIDKKIIFYGNFDEFCKSSKMSDYFGAGQHIICHRH